MTLVLELRPDQERRLQDTAAAQGLTVEQLVSEFIGGAAPQAVRTQDQIEEWDRKFVAATRGFGPAPRTPPLSELRRDGFYEDPEGKN